MLQNKSYKSYTYRQHINDFNGQLTHVFRQGSLFRHNYSFSAGMFGNNRLFLHSIIEKVYIRLQLVDR